MIFADRDNTAASTFRGNGTNESGGTSGSAGTIYMKSGTLDLRGNGYSLSSLIVVDQVSMDGNPSRSHGRVRPGAELQVTHPVTTTTYTVLLRRLRPGPVDPARRRRHAARLIEWPGAVVSDL